MPSDSSAARNRAAAPEERHYTYPLETRDGQHECVRLTISPDGCELVHTDQQGRRIGYYRTPRPARLVA